MINKNSMSVTVRSTGKTDKVYFSRIIDDNAGDVDISVIISALRMLFSSETFKIIIETYGA